MKSKRLLLTLLLALFVPWAAFGQGTLPIGTGTNMSSSGYSAGVGAGSPMGNTYYYNSAAQFVYTASELGGAKTINSLAFNHNDYSFSATVNIYLTHTTASTVDVSSPATSGTLVYTGTGIALGGSSAGWQTFNFNSNFEYNGTDNLLVVVCRTNYSNGYSESQGWQYTETTDNKFMVRSSDTDTYGDITNTSNSYTASTNRPNVIIGYVLTTPYVTLDPTSATVMTGFTQTLTATVGNVSGTPTINYSSSDTHVATVSGSGYTATVTGVALGTCTITASMNYQGTDYTATCAVTVEAPHPCTPSFSYTGTNYGIYIAGFSTTEGETNISNTTSLTSGGYADYYGTHFASAEAGQPFDFTVTPGGTANTMVYAMWIDWNQDYDFDDEGEQVARQSTGIKAEWTGTVSIPAETPEGEYRMRVMLAYSGTSTLTPCISATYGEAEDYKLVVLPAADCPKPNGLEVTFEGSVATATWNGTTNSYNIDINGTVTNDVTTPYYFDVELSTLYTVTVQANCDGGKTSDWSIPSAIYTGCNPDDMCELSYEFTTNPNYSSYGWYGSYIKVMDANTDEVLTTWTVAQDGDGTAAGTFAVCDGREIRFEWYSANANNDQILIDSYAIYDANGDVITSGTGPMTTPVNYTMNCPDCTKPTNLAASVMHTSATLSWEGYQEEYNLRYRTAAYHDIILEQDFENGLGDWQVVNNHTANTAEINGTYFRSGANSFRFQSWNNSSDGYDQYLISPMLNKSAIFSFYYRAHGGNYGPDSFIIGYSTTGNDVENDFTWDNATATSTSTTNWTEFQYAIPSETKYIAIQYTSNFNEYLYIDDIQILGEDHPEGEWVTRNNVTSPQEVTNLTINTKYEWQVQGICSEGNSDWAARTFNTLRDSDKVFMTAGNWCDETNWEGGIPTAGDQAYIYAAATIPAGCEATVSAITMYEGGSITIQDGGELTHKSPGTVVTIEKNIIGYTGETDRYYLISSTGGMNPTDVTNLLTGEYDFYSFDGAQENEEWRNYKTATFNMANGMGYLYANDDDVTLRFTGSLMDRNTYYYCGGSTSSYLTYDESKPWGTFNLVGNTYTCKGYLYLYSSSITPITDFYVMNPEGTEIVPSENEYLLPNQGAFIQSTELNQYALISGIAPSRSVSNEVLDMTVFGSTNSDMVRIRFAEGRGLEKFQINPNHTKLYIPMEGKDYAVVSAGNVGEMPVSFKAEKNGSYTIGFNTKNVEFSYLHLIDNMTGADVDLLETPTYTFSAKTTDYANRFKLVFATGNSVDGDSFAFINGAGNLSIFGIEGTATVQVMDVLGHVVSSNTFSGSYECKLNVAPGVYMIRLIQGNDVKIQKMVIR